MLTKNFNLITPKFCKRVIEKSLLLLSILCFSFNNSVFAEDIDKISSDFVLVSPKTYDQKTVSKHYNVYDVTILNNNVKPILLSSDSEVYFVLKDDSVVKSETRRNIYRKTRKKDVGRYYSFGIPGAVIAGGITGITLFLGSPIAAAIYCGMMLPVDKAVRTNVKISQDIFNINSLPMKFEVGEKYNVRIFAPKEYNIKEIIISNVSFNLEDMYEMKIKAGNLCMK